MSIEQLAGLAVLVVSGLALWDSLRAAPPPPRQQGRDPSLMPQGRDVDEFLAELKAQLAAQAADPFAISIDCGPPGLPVAYLPQQVGPLAVLHPVCLAPTCLAPPLDGSPWCLIHGLDRPGDLAHVFAAHRAAPLN